VSFQADLDHASEVTRLEDTIEELTSKVDDLEVDVEGLNDDISDLESQVSLLEEDVFDRDRLLNEAYNRVGHAVDDLKAIGEVPLSEVIDCVDAVVENLRAVLA
jgi:uncharacterized protein YoxC